VRRFYCSDLYLEKKEARLTDSDELHHLRHVLRMRPKDAIVVCDGQGLQAEGTIQALSTREAIVKIQSWRREQRPVPEFILACAIPKKTKFETIVEKATELGVDTIVPLKTERTILSLTADRLARKRARYQAVALNAAKQSQRVFLPNIFPVTSFSEVFEVIEDAQWMIPSLCGPRRHVFHVFQEEKTPRRWGFLIGPEGDFTPEEYTLARMRGARPVTLGSTILKVETAALCVLSAANLFYRSPDIGQ